MVSLVSLAQTQTKMAEHKENCIMQKLDVLFNISDGFLTSEHREMLDK